MNKSVMRIALSLFTGISACASASSGPPEDALCGQLTPLMEASREHTPFASLTEPTQNGVSFDYIDAPVSLNISNRCMVYIAYSPEGVVGGGTHNKVECDLARYDKTSDYTDTTRERREALIAQLSSCKALSTWSRSDSNPSLRVTETSWADPDSDLEIAAQREYISRHRSGGVYETRLVLRKPAPVPASD